MAKKLLIPTSRGLEFYRPDLAGMDLDLEPLPDLGETTSQQRWYFAAAVSSDNKRLALGRGSAAPFVVTVDLEERTFDEGWPPFTRSLADMHWSMDGEHIAAGHHGGTGGGMRILDRESKAIVSTLLGSSQAVPAVRYSPDGQYLAAHHALGNRFSMWSLPGYAPVADAPPILSFTAKGLEWSDDSAFIVIGAESGSVRLVDVAARSVETIPIDLANSTLTRAKWRPGTHEFSVAGWHQGRNRAELAIVDADTLDVTYHQYARPETGFSSELSWYASSTEWVNSTDLVVVGVRNSAHLMIGTWRVGEGYLGDTVDAPRPLEDGNFFNISSALVLFDDPTDPPPPTEYVQVERTRRVLTTDDALSSGAIILTSPGGSRFRVVASLEGELATRPSNSTRVDTHVLEGPGGELFLLGVTDEGALTTSAQVVPGFIHEHARGPLLPTPDPHVLFELSVDADGALTTLEA